MSASAGIGQAGITAQRGVATTTVFIDDINYPVMNVQHTAQGGSINLSAGPNPSQGFNVQQTQVGNSQVFTGPNVLVSNVLQAPQSAILGTANVGTALNVTGPSTLTGNTTVTGSFTTTGSTSIGNVLQIGNTTITPTLLANVISVTGPNSNVYIETSSSRSSNTSALYLSPSWRLKVLTNNGLATQYLYNGNWINIDVKQPTGFIGSIASLLNYTV